MQVHYNTIPNSLQAKVSRRKRGIFVKIGQRQNKLPCMNFLSKSHTAVSAGWGQSYPSHTFIWNFSGFYLFMGPSSWCPFGHHHCNVDFTVSLSCQKPIFFLNCPLRIYYLRIVIFDWYCDFAAYAFYGNSVSLKVASGRIPISTWDLSSWIWSIYCHR